MSGAMFDLVKAGRNNDFTGKIPLFQYEMQYSLFLLSSKRMFRKLGNLVLFAETPFQFHKGFRTLELVSLQCLRGIRTVRCIFLMTEVQHI